MPNSAQLKRKALQVSLEGLREAVQEFSTCFPAKALEKLSNLAIKPASKSKAFEVWDWPKYLLFVKLLIRRQPSLDPTYGMLRKGAEQLLGRLKFQYRANEETLQDLNQWGGRILADRMSAVRYHFRKLLRSPNLFLRTVEALEDHYKKMGQTDLAEDTTLSLHGLLLAFEDDPSAELEGMILGQEETRSLSSPAQETEDKILESLEDEDRPPPRLMIHYNALLKKEAAEKEAKSAWRK